MKVFARSVVPKVFVIIAAAALGCAPFAAMAGETAPAKPEQSATAPMAPTKGSQAGDDLSAGGARGVFVEEVSICEVPPPCPAGCKEDTTHKMCVEKPEP